MKDSYQLAGPGSHDDEPGPVNANPKPPKPVAEMTLSERIKEAGEAAEELYCRCWGLVRIAQTNSEHYLKVQHVWEAVGPEEANFHPGWHMTELVMNDMENSKNLDALLARFKELIDGLSMHYNVVSAGALTIGPVSGSNAHTTAILLTEHLRELWNEHRLEYLPVLPSVTDSDDTRAVAAALPKWRENATRFASRLAAITGIDLAANFSKWVAILRVEADKALAALPREPAGHQLSTEESLLVNALKKAGKKLTQTALCEAAGLKQTGSRNAMLANLAARGILRSSSKGYSLPEWEPQ